MHRGVREFIEWVDQNRTMEGVKLNPPASTNELASLEQMLGGPLPEDLRLVLTRFNGGVLPAGEMLPAGIEPGTIGAAVREYADAVSEDFLDPELLLPFYRTTEGSLLAFDRSAGPVSDTWPIVDYYEDTGDHRLVHRTFDGWCRNCLADWSSPDFQAPFTLDTYLRQGLRHVEVEPDVATAHATVAHASKRAGLPEQALMSYLLAARCVPPLPWCDWEALKIAVLLRRPVDTFEAAARLCARAPERRWEQRETTPGMLAEVLGPMVQVLQDPEPWMRLLAQLVDQQHAADEDDHDTARAIRDALEQRKPLPPPRPIREEPVVPPQADIEGWWQAAKTAYYEGRLRDEDLLLEPTMQHLRGQRDFAELLRIRRDF